MSLTTTDLKQIAALFNVTIEPLIDHSDQIDQRLTSLSTDIKELRESLTGEIKELRTMLVQSQTGVSANFVRIETNLDDHIHSCNQQFKNFAFPQTN